KNRYDSTISECKETSIAKAMEILMEEINDSQKHAIPIRPRVSLTKGLVPFIVYFSCFITLLAFSKKITDAFSISFVAFLIIVFLVFSVMGILLLKRFLLWAILIYQKFAPMKVRMACVFEPSCSDYMRIAIQKYGVIKGVYKGMNRLSRCHFPNGGIDNP
ncbi:MAG: membrane protein insertion efficiency factor YidD, partial [Prevotella sp.]|nr:membrane protein insertion efficiency factor YidD [Prevotella sp.]